MEIFSIKICKDFDKNSSIGHPVKIFFVLIADMMITIQDLNVHGKKLKESSNFEKFSLLKKVNSAFSRNFFENSQNSQKCPESHKNWNKCIYKVKFAELLHKMGHQARYVVNTALCAASHISAVKSFVPKYIDSYQNGHPRAIP